MESKEQFAYNWIKHTWINAYLICYACFPDGLGPTELVFFTGPVTLQLTVNLFFFILTSMNYNKVKTQIRKVLADPTDQRNRRFQGDREKWVKILIIKLIKIKLKFIIRTSRRKLREHDVYIRKSLFVSLIWGIRNWLSLDLYELGIFSISRGSRLSWKTRINDRFSDTGIFLIYSQLKGNGSSLASSGDLGQGRYRKTQNEDNCGDTSFSLFNFSFSLLSKSNLGNCNQK